MKSTHCMRFTRVTLREATLALAMAAIPMVGGCSASTEHDELGPDTVDEASSALGSLEYKEARPWSSSDGEALLYPQVYIPVAANPKITSGLVGTSPAAIASSSQTIAATVEASASSGAS